MTNNEADSIIESVVLSMRAIKVLAYLRDYVGHNGGQYRTIISKRVRISYNNTLAALGELSRHGLVYSWTCEKRTVVAPTKWK